MIILDIAKVCHEVNAAYCVSIGDKSQLSWEESPTWQKDSAILGVKFHLLNPDATPSSSHDSWMEQKTIEGWTFGEIKDPILKTHPCYVPYGDLPVAQQSKDFLSKQVVNSLRSFLD